MLNSLRKLKLKQYLFLQVLKSGLKVISVIGMYHTSGPVTALCVLASDEVRASDAAHLVAGDKCGRVHFLQWLPPKGDEEKRDEEGEKMDCENSRSAGKTRFSGM